MRDLLRERGCDCLVAPGAGQETSRYLNQSPMSAWVVFPLNGDVFPLPPAIPVHSTYRFAANP